MPERLKEFLSAVADVIKFISGAVLLTFARDLGHALFGRARKRYHRRRERGRGPDGQDDNGPQANRDGG